MKIIRTLLFVLVGLVAIATIFSFLGPKTSELSRTVNIDASKEAIFPYVKSLKQMDRWSPWSRQDENIANTWEGEDGTVGSKNTWTSEIVGVGSQTVTKIVDNDLVETLLEFKEPFEGKANASVKLADGNTGGTDIVWGFNSENGFVERIIFFFNPLENDLGPQYEEGLGYLKELVESEVVKAEVITTEEVVPVEQ